MTLWIRLCLHTYIHTVHVYVLIYVHTCIHTYTGKHRIIYIYIYIGMADAGPGRSAQRKQAQCIGLSATRLVRMGSACVGAAAIVHVGGGRDVWLAAGGSSGECHFHVVAVHPVAIAGKFLACMRMYVLSRLTTLMIFVWREWAVICGWP